MGVEPCTNPNCKSCGQPHPNCKCQQFADGGEVEPTWENTTPIESAAPAKAAAEEPTWENTTPIAGGADEPTWENTTPIEPTWETTTGKYDTSLQKIGAGLEGVAKGIAGPLATGAELLLSKAGVPGLSAEDIAGRAEANPGIAGLGETAGLVGSAFIPGGQAKVAAQVASKAAQLLKIEKAATWAAKLGTGALKGAIETGLFQVSDNASKALLGQGDPHDSLAGTLADGVGPVALVGSLFGSVGAGITKKIDDAALKKSGTFLHSWLSGMGEAAKGISPEESVARELNKKAYDNGVDWFNSHIAKKAIYTGAGATAYYHLSKGLEEGDPISGGANALEDLAKGTAVAFGIKKLSKVAGAALLKALSNGEMQPRALFQIIDHGNKIANGVNKTEQAVDALFKPGSYRLLDKYDFAKHNLTLDEYIENGGIDQNIEESMHQQNNPEGPQGFAEGGEVKKPKREKASVAPVQHDDAFATNFPEQNLLLNTARGRVSNYLTALRPKKDQPKLAFDDEPDQRQQKRSYTKALDIANQPLVVLEKIRNGQIEPEHIKHLNALYPELTGVLQKKITDRITKAQLAGEKPDYKTRQGLSLLLGTPLSSELKPQNIQSAQAVFQAQKQAAAQPQGGPAPKRKTSSLTKSDDSFLTKSQSLVSRSQRQ